MEYAIWAKGVNYEPIDNNIEHCSINNHPTVDCPVFVVEL